MSLASVLQDTKARLDSLLSYANETTGQSDVSIGDAIKTLADGFGGGDMNMWETLVDTELTESLSQYIYTFDVPVKKARLTVWAKVNVGGWKSMVLNNKTALCLNNDTGANRAVTLTLDSTNANGYVTVEAMEYQNLANGLNGGLFTKTYRDFASISDGITRIGFTTSSLFPAGALVKVEVIR